MKNLAFRTPAASSWIAATAFAAALVLTPALALGEAAPTRLCLTSNELPFAKGDPRIPILEEKIAARFEQGPFSVVRGQPIRAVLGELDLREDEVLDAVTGEAIPGRIESHRAALGRVLRERLDCVGGIRIRVESVLARRDGKWAIWDGARTAIDFGEGGPLESSREMQDQVAAISLWVELVDSEGRELAFRSGAIEPLSHLRSFRPLDRLPDERWLRDEEALDAAIERTLGPKALYLRDRGNPTWQFPESSLVWPKS